MIAVRPATIVDAEAIAAVHVASWRETYRGLVPDAMIDGLSVEGRTAMWRAAMERDPPVASVFVATVADGRIVGFAAGGLNRGTGLTTDGEVYALYVLRTAQRQGTGRTLMASIASRLLDRGCVKAEVWVLRENALGRGFYERLGGRLIGEKVDEHGDAILSEVAYGWDDLRPLAAWINSNP